ncbi:MAG TPA: aminomethyltransferase family protein, partial [Mycoplana sp.]|nr:aminomethyltransferase family protein [Mycoplana sp.]
HGGIECDLTAARIADDEYYIVTGTGFATHDFDWIARNIPAGLEATLKDVTDDWSVLVLMGPKSRSILQGLTEDDLSNNDFPFGTVRTIAVAGRAVRAMRITYVGELGWELHLPVADAAAVYDALMQAGRTEGLVNAGYRALETCRLEKGYRAWGSDIGPDHTPVEAGLAWAVKIGGQVDFCGRAAVERQLAEGVRKMLVCFVPDDPETVLLGRETIYRNGERAGWLTSGGFGHTVGKAIGLGYVRNRNGVDAAYVSAGAYELDVGGRRVPCTPHLAPLYDPHGIRVRN